VVVFPEGGCKNLSAQTKKHAKIYTTYGANKDIHQYSGQESKQDDKLKTYNISYKGINDNAWKFISGTAKQPIVTIHNWDPHIASNLTA
jgi:hypothetical protein